jgi:hypothetical protein
VETGLEVIGIGYTAYFTYNYVVFQAGEGGGAGHWLHLIERSSQGDYLRLVTGSQLPVCTQRGSSRGAAKVEGK